MWRRASTSATNEPVMAAVRVPPSAWITSQSTHSVRSPSAFMSTTALSERPIRRWISCVRPDGWPLVASRWERVLVERGSIPYSEVIQPSPLPLRKGGTRSSTLTVHTTLVSPTSMSAEPSACLLKRGVTVTGRSWSGARPSLRMFLPFSSSLGSICSLKSPMRKPIASVRAGRTQAVEPPVVLAVREDAHDVVASLREGNALAELLGRHVRAAGRPGVDPVRARIVRRERLLHAPSELVQHLLQVQRAQLQAHLGVVQVARAW